MIATTSVIFGSQGHLGGTISCKPGAGILPWDAGTAQITALGWSWYPARLTAAAWAYLLAHCGVTYGDDRFTAAQLNKRAFTGMSAPLEHTSGGNHAPAPAASYTAPTSGHCCSLDIDGSQKGNQGSSLVVKRALYFPSHSFSLPLSQVPLLCLGLWAH